MVSEALHALARNYRGASTGTLGAPAKEAVGFGGSVRNQVVGQKVHDYVGAFDPQTMAI
jgi:hypothetical protein